MTRITIIVPAYNEQSRLDRSLARLRVEFECDPDFDLVVVDDGSTDDTAAVAWRALEGWPAARLTRLPWNQGKGSAIKAGVAVAEGDYVVLMDADLSGDLADLRSLTAALTDADIVIGTRMAAGSRVEYFSERRRNMSRVFNVLACATTGVTASDTQCGYKAMRTPAAKLLFHLAQTRGYAVDVEILILAKLLGFTVCERQIGWREMEGSQVRIWRDTFLMLRDIERVRRAAARHRNRLGAEQLGAFARDMSLSTSHAAPSESSRQVIDLRAVEPSQLRIS